MNLRIVLNSVRDAINGEIDRALNGRHCEPDERERIYLAMLDEYDNTGRLGELTLTAKSEGPSCHAKS